MLKYLSKLIDYTPRKTSCPPPGWDRFIKGRGMERPWISAKIINQLLESENKFMVHELGRAPLPTEKGDWTYIVFGDLTHGSQHHMLVFGDLPDGKDMTDREDILVRIHSSCHTNEVFGAINCECRAQLHGAMEMIETEKKGVILYLDQEGRGNGMTAKLAQLSGMFEWKNGKIVQKVDPETGERIDTDMAYTQADYPSESRDFSMAGEMLKSIGVKSVRLLTNNPRKIAGIENAGIRIVPIEIHITPENEIIATDLRAKANKLGHTIRKEHLKVKP